MAILPPKQHNSRMSMKNQFPLNNYVDLLLDVICVVDIDGRFLFVSAACEQIFGYTPEEMIGKTTFELMHPEDVEKTRQIVKEIMTGDAKPLNEKRYIHKQGHVVHIMWSARWSEEDQVRIGVARDITKQKQAEMAQNAGTLSGEVISSGEALLLQCAFYFCGDISVDVSNGGNSTRATGSVWDRTNHGILLFDWRDLLANDVANRSWSSTIAETRTIRRSGSNRRCIACTNHIPPSGSERAWDRDRLSDVDDSRRDAVRSIPVVSRSWCCRARRLLGIADERGRRSAVAGEIVLVVGGVPWVRIGSHLVCFELPGRRTP